MAQAVSIRHNHLLPMLLLMLSGCRSSEPTQPIVHTKSQKTYYNFGITRQPVTLQIPIPAHEDTHYLVIENPHINQLTVGFAHRSDSIATGDHRPFDSRPIRHRFFVIPIPPAMTPDTAVVTLAKTGENLSFHLQRYNARQWQRFRDWDNNLSGVVAGFYLFLLLLSIFVVLFVKSRKSVLMGIFILFTSIWLLNDAGIFYQHFWPQHPDFHNQSRSIFSSLNMITFGLYLYQDIHHRLAWGLGWVIKTLITYLGLKVFFFDDDRRPKLV